MSMVYDPEAKQIDPRPVPQVASSHVLDLFSMKGKVVAVSGAAAGIGFAAAEAMAEAGADVALWYNSNDAAIKKGEELAKRTGVKVKAYKVGVTDLQEVRKAVEQVVEDFGKLDVAIANAGVGIAGGILEQTPEQFHKQTNVNYFGVYHVAKAAGEVFQKQGHGNLIITSSMSAHIVNVPVDQGAYNASKAACTMLGKCLAREWGAFARVNMVSPGFFQTDMGAGPQVLQEAYRMAVLGRQGDTRELKGIYLYLASDASTYTTGSDFIVDGGYTLS
ncbi:l-xylulose reductase [Ceraceosorus bombacis]|uniref:L-xylulose reductase n=1 Tax=Ceraceosorus bombacis TaxID=401625 RepID=A0A0P1BM06_9BASI|nr:l-xylulose reductase [Ceraceosorus bombacis]